MGCTSSQEADRGHGFTPSKPKRNSSKGSPTKEVGPLKNAVQKHAQYEEPSPEDFEKAVEQARRESATKTSLAVMASLEEATGREPGSTSMYRFGGGDMKQDAQETDILLHMAPMLAAYSGDPEAVETSIHQHVAPLVKRQASEQDIEEAVQTHVAPLLFKPGTAAPDATPNASQKAAATPEAVAEQGPTNTAITLAGVAKPVSIEEAVKEQLKPLMADKESGKSGEGADIEGAVMAHLAPLLANKESADPSTLNEDLAVTAQVMRFLGPLISRTKAKKRGPKDVDSVSAVAMMHLAPLMAARSTVAQPNDIEAAVREYVAPLILDPEAGSRSSMSLKEAVTPQVSEFMGDLMHRVKNKGGQTKDVQDVGESILLHLAPMLATTPTEPKDIEQAVMQHVAPLMLPVELADPVHPEVAILDHLSPLIADYTHDFINGEAVLTAMGEGTVIDAHGENGMLVVQLPYGVAYMNPAIVKHKGEPSSPMKGRRYSIKYQHIAKQLMGKEGTGAVHTRGESGGIAGFKWISRNGSVPDMNAAAAAIPEGVALPASDDTHNFINGEAVLTAMGEGTVIDAHGENGMLVVQLPYGVAYMNPAIVKHKGEPSSPMKGRRYSIKYQHIAKQLMGKEGTGAVHTRGESGGIAGFKWISRNGSVPDMNAAAAAAAAIPEGVAQLATEEGAALNAEDTEVARAKRVEEASAAAKQLLADNQEKARNLLKNKEESGEGKAEDTEAARAKRVEDAAAAAKQLLADNQQKAAALAATNGNAAEEVTAAVADMAATVTDKATAEADKAAATVIDEATGAAEGAEAARAKRVEDAAADAKQLLAENQEKAAAVTDKRPSLLEKAGSFLSMGLLFNDKEKAEQAESAVDDEQGGDVVEEPIVPVSPKLSVMQRIQKLEEEKNLKEKLEAERRRSMER